LFTDDFLPKDRRRLSRGAHLLSQGGAPADKATVVLMKSEPVGGLFFTLAVSGLMHDVLRWD
jgi:hypothetical protein